MINGNWCSCTNIQLEQHQSLNGTTKYLLYKMVEMFWQFFIFMELPPFSYYCVITKTPNLSNIKW